MTSIIERVRAGDLFDSLGREGRKKEEKRIEINKNNCIEWLVDDYHLFCLEKDSPLSSLGGIDPKKDYLWENAMERLKCNPYPITSKDIQEFLLLFDQKMKPYLGKYASACFYTCKDKEVEINLAHLDFKPNYIGWNNSSKNINVSGNVGSFLGRGMSGGEIIVNGTAYDSLGRDMKGGIIRVKKLEFDPNEITQSTLLNEIYGIGWNMSGGEIHIEGGDIAQTSAIISGGDVYYKGKLIVKDGKVVK
jgi:hypothetical protein